MRIASRPPPRAPDRAPPRRRHAVAATAAWTPAHPLPTSLADVNNANILGYGAELAPDHPGYHDAAYKRRRAELAALAAATPVDAPPPRVEYTQSELETWAHVHDSLAGLHPALACAEFNAAVPLLGLTRDAVPQLADVDATLRARTGWRLRPVAGLLHPRDFLAGLAFRAFHATAYMRWGGQAGYTPEPDLAHEAAHLPLLAVPSYARLAHAIGVASLGASNEDIWHLIKVYWYTVEFGVVMEGATPKAFGAGILSSPGELRHFASGAATLTPFDPAARQPKMAYNQGYQTRYFTLPSFAAGAELLTRYALSRVDPSVAERYGLVGPGDGWVTPVQPVNNIVAVPEREESKGGQPTMID